MNTTPNYQRLNIDLLKKPADLKSMLVPVLLWCSGCESKGSMPIIILLLSVIYIIIGESISHPTKKQPPEWNAKNGRKPQSTYYVNEYFSEQMRRVMEWIGTKDSEKE